MLFLAMRLFPSQQHYGHRFYPRQDLLLTNTKLVRGVVVAKASMSLPTIQSDAIFSLLVERGAKDIYIQQN
jgi:hypothetical protein